MTDLSFIFHEVLRKITFLFEQNGYVNIKTFQNSEYNECIKNNYLLALSEMITRFIIIDINSHILNKTEYPQYFQIDKMSGFYGNCISGIPWYCLSEKKSIPDYDFVNKLKRELFDNGILNIFEGEMVPEYLAKKGLTDINQIKMIE